jgi:hypothetical protein
VEAGRADRHVIPQLPRPYLSGDSIEIISDINLSETHSETIEVVYASAEEWWAFLMTLGPRATILGMNEEMRARFKDEYIAKLRPVLRKNGLHFSVSVVYAKAQR